MTVLVSPYHLLESQKGKLKMCHDPECMFVPVWEVRQQIAEKPDIGYACSQHIDTVLYLVLHGLINSDKEDPGGVIPESGQGQ